MTMRKTGKWNDDCVDFTKWMRNLFWLACLTVSLYLIFGKKDEVMEPFSPLGPFQVPRHLFLLFACVFATVIATKLRHWMEQYRKKDEELPLLTLLCFIASEVVLIVSCIMPSLWLLSISFLFVIRMTMDAVCRYYTTSASNGTWNRSESVKVCCYCVSVSIGIAFCTWRFVSDVKWFNYTALLPPLLVIPPMILMSFKEAHEAKDFADYAWYPTVAVSVCIAAAAQVCFSAMIPMVSSWAEQNGKKPEYYMYNILSVVVIFCLIGVIGSYMAVPRWGSITKKG